MGFKHFVHRIKSEIGDHGSAVARIGAKLDPVQRITGLDKPSIEIADKSNALFSKIGTTVDQYGRKLDPVRRIPIVDRIATQINKRPVDAAAAAAGAYFGGSALYNAFGAGGATGAGTGGAGGGPLSEGAFNAETAWAGGAGGGGGAAGGGMGMSWLDYLGLGSQLGGSALSAYGQDRASRRAAAADQAAIDEQRRQYEQNRTDLEPWRLQGVNALSDLTRLSNGDYSGFMTSPDYLVARDQALKDVQGSAAGRGTLFSGNTLAALTKKSGDLATMNLNNYRSLLLSRAGLGQTATTTGVSAGADTARGIAGLTSQAGDARASGIAGGYNALANGLSTAGGYLYGRNRPIYGYGG